MGEGQKRQDEERKRRPDQTREVRADIKGKNVQVSGWCKTESTRHAHL